MSLAPSRTPAELRTAREGIRSLDRSEGEEEEGLFKAIALNEVDAGRDRATPALVDVTPHAVL